MKLRNKKTGEIIDLNKGHICETVSGESIRLRPDIKLGNSYTYNSLAEFNEYWEDYEEPKGVNEIDVLLNAIDEYRNNHLFDNKYMDRLKILNIAENKLMALKRLKDKGFRFKDWEVKNGHKIFFALNDDSFNAGWLDPEIVKDLDLLFGVENETINL